MKIEITKWGYPNDKIEGYVETCRVCQKAYDHRHPCRCGKENHYARWSGSQYGRDVRYREWCERELMRIRKNKHPYREGIYRHWIKWTDAKIEKGTGENEGKIAITIGE